ncbi:MAG: hypothetical protein UY70_C0004G0029 [Candidatus Kaiserbacteria bacterium GW2011_GWB1_52_6]|uniref:Nudix hydrolase domain-containing protein n=3 Tax=Candidatus Kaiseribacteriota TaxID=1752734 RepID=A0A0G1XB12_9BACT|nr:MAG: hypothetical protein UY70_C0004G0029 [Candidatus Kaiserbacteria bacterium GW2011_GWB1_52_6]
MMFYTLGFIFDPTMERIVLMEKQRPVWQRGKLNGVGGKLEKGETGVACMVRETREECGINSEESAWTHIAVMTGGDWRVDVFGHIAKKAQPIVCAREDEGKVDWYEIAAIPENALSNVPWLVHLAKDKLRNKKFHQCEIVYSQ